MEGLLKIKAAAKLSKVTWNRLVKSFFGTLVYIHGIKNARSHN